MPRRQFLACVACAVVTVMFGIQEFSTVHWGAGPRSWQSILLIQSATWGAWSAIMWLVVQRLWPRVPDSERYSPLHLFGHLGLATALGIAACGIGAAVSAFYYFGLSEAALWDMFRNRLHTILTSNVLAYGAVLAAVPLRQRPPAEAAPPYLRRFIARHDGRLLVVPSTDVDWLEADDDTVRLHTGKTVHTTRDTLTSLARRLDPRRFARIHRSTIVNLERVREIQRWFKGEHVLLLTNGTRLTIGPTFRAALLERLHGDR